MKYIADLHTHSPFSRATSKASTLAGLFAWAKVKGIHLVATGDFTHPGWLSRLKEELSPAEPGFFRLKNEKVPAALENLAPEDIPTRFILTAEISSIYKRHGAVRKIHNLLYVPDFASVEKINATLAGIGNIESDGRPILGLDARDLLEILLEQAPDGFLVPAHIWTPWFSLFGSKSGFDAIEDCFGDLTDHIFALETGLSSDPEMNRTISALDRFAFISNSDCHSPAKLGREANIFDTEFSYVGVRDALKNPKSAAFNATIEFFPEEGKYHCDGHRKCRVCLEPSETRTLKNVCPVCGRPLTVGVLHRVMELADRTEPWYPEGSPATHSLIPLPEVLGEIIGAGPATKGVMTQYRRIIAKTGSEFNLYLNTPQEELNRISPVLGEAVKRIRRNQVIRRPGYDGEFGVIRVFEEGELDDLSGQISLFTGRKPRKKKAAAPKRAPLEKGKATPPVEGPRPRESNPEQEKAITCPAAKILVSAGPGTGKTFTLVARLEHLLNSKNTKPGACAAITFTNRAAAEIKERLAREIGPGADEVFVGTFHRFCLDRLRTTEPNAVVVGDEARAVLVKNTFPDWDRPQRKAFGDRLAAYSEDLAAGKDAATRETAPEINRYLLALAKLPGVDLNLVIPSFVRQLHENEAFRQEVCGAVDFLFVDEFQDLNRSQFELVRVLAGQARVFAIGDPNQAIYGFRGSDLRFFHEFGATPGAQTLALIRNYRSAPEIIEAATAVIHHNQEQGESDLAPQSSLRGVIEYYPAPTPQAEAEFIVRRIEEIMGGISHFSINSGRGGKTASQKSFGDFAVASRLSRQADAIVEALSRRGIPFQIIGATPFYLSPALRPLYRWIRAARPNSGTADCFALLENINGIGAATLNTLEKAIPLGTPAENFLDAAGRASITDKAKQILRTVFTARQCFQEKAHAEGLAQGLQDALPLFPMAGAERETTRFLELAGAFGQDLATFASHLAQNAQATIYDDRAEAVAVMTMHATKGLEFPVVFLAGLEEGLIPCTIGSTPSDVEEERRLFYVAMTRAREMLCLSSAASRAVHGKVSRQQVSRFVEEIPARLLTKAESRKRGKKPAITQMKLF